MGRGAAGRFRLVSAQRSSCALASSSSLASCWCRAQPTLRGLREKICRAVHLYVGAGPAVSGRDRGSEQPGVDPRPRLALRAVGGVRKRQHHRVSDDGDRRQCRQRPDRLDERRRDVPLRGRRSRADLDVGRADLRRTRPDARQGTHGRRHRPHVIASLVAPRREPQRHRGLLHAPERRLRGLRLRSGRLELQADGRSVARERRHAVQAESRHRRQRHADLRDVRRDRQSRRQPRRADRVDVAARGEQRADHSVRRTDGRALLRRHAVEPRVGSQPERRRSATGLGDVAVRAKLNIHQSPAGSDVALLGEARFATGDADQLLGAGNFSARGLAIFSARFGNFSPH